MVNFLQIFGDDNTTESISLISNYKFLTVIDTRKTLSDIARIFLCKNILKLFVHMKDHYLNVIFIKLSMCEERMQKNVKIISDACIIMRMPMNNTI